MRVCASTSICPMQYYSMSLVTCSSCLWFVKHPNMNSCTPIVCSTRQENTAHVNKARQSRSSNCLECWGCEQEGKDSVGNVPVRCSCTPMSLYLHACRHNILRTANLGRCTLPSWKLFELYKCTVIPKLEDYSNCTQIHIGKSREHYHSSLSTRPLRLSSSPSPDNHHQHLQIMRSSQWSYTQAMTLWRSSYTCSW